MRDQILDLVRHYFGRVKPSGNDNVIFSCPFHEDRHPSFSVNIQLGLFHCFSCKRGGTLPNLLLEIGIPAPEVDRETGDLRKIIEENRKKKIKEQKADFRRSDLFRAATILSEATLKVYTQFYPTNLVEMGFSIEWLRHMEIGFDINNNRVIYPVRDIYGNLAGVVGGAVYGTQDPKYKFYEGKVTDKDGKIWPSIYGEWFDETYPNYVFRPHDHLWNFDRVYPRVLHERVQTPTIILVEGFKACLWMLQNGYWNTVALMGSYLSWKQLQLLFRLSCNIVLFLDQDKAGKEGTEKIGSMLNKTRPGVFFARYPVDTDKYQPDHLVPEELESAITGAMTYPEYKKGATLWVSTV